MIAQLFRAIFGYTYITRKYPRSFNEVHKTSCRYGKSIAQKRYMTKEQAYVLIVENSGKRNYDGCRHCMPSMNTEEIKKNIKSSSK